MSVKFRTYYMDSAVFELPVVLDKANAALPEVEFDTIVGTGFSGSIVIPALALIMNKRFVLIRKESDDSHHGGGLLVGDLGERWIFVDDFILSGRTRERVMLRVSQAAGPRARMVGQYLYGGYTDAPTRFEPYNPDWA